MLFDVHLQEQINLGRGSSGRTQRYRNPQHQTPKSQNWAEATRLLRLAVAQGHADAHIVLADLLSDGDRKIVFKES